MTTEPEMGGAAGSGMIGREIGQSLFEIRRQFNALVEPHRSDLWRYCLYLAGSAWDAEDLVQETLLKAFARLSTLFQPVAVKPYLFRIASNAWIDAKRRATGVDEVLDDDFAAEEPPVEADPIATRAAIERMVTVLPPRQRVVCLLADVFDLSMTEIARILGVTPGAAKAMLSRARVALKGREALSAGPANLARIDPAPNDALVLSYLDAFNRRDLDALIALLQPEAVSDILGVFVEYGRETIKSGSLGAWVRDTKEQWARAGTLEGRPVFFVFVRQPTGEEALGWLVELGFVGGEIGAIRDYFYCADFVRFAAAALGVAALPNEPF